MRVRAPPAAPRRPAAPGRRWAKQELVFTDRLLVILVCLRTGLTHEALGVIYQAGSSTIGRAIGEIRPLSGRQVPVACDTRERGHGRAERRTLKITAVTAGLAFPHAAQAIQIVRRRKLGRKKWSAETCYAVTSLTATQASPAGLAAIIRGHWAIEDRLHWVATWTSTKTAPRSAPPAAPASWPACAI
jgi:hypothetical protein